VICKAWVMTLGGYLYLTTRGKSFSGRSGMTRLPGMEKDFNPSMEYRQ